MPVAVLATMGKAISYQNIATTQLSPPNHIINKRPFSSLFFNPLNNSRMKYSKSIIALVVMAEAASKQQQVLAEDWYGTTAHPTLYPTYVDDSYWGGDAGSEEDHASYGSKTSKTTSKTGKTSGKGGKGTISKVGKVEPYPTITEGEWSSNYHHEMDSRDDGGGWGYEHKNPTILPSFSPTLSPTHEPTLEPTLEPTHSPTHAYIKHVPDPEPHWESKVTKEPEPSWHAEPVPEPEPHWESKVTKEPEPEPHWESKVTKEPEPSWHAEPVPEPEPHWESKVTKEPEPEPHWESKVTKEPEPSWHVEPVPEPEPNWESKTTKEPESSWHVEPVPEPVPVPVPEPHWDATESSHSAAMEWGVPVTPSESGKGSKTEKTRRGLRRLL